MGEVRVVPVEEALRRAFWTVKVPSMALFFVPILSYLVLAELEIVPSMGYPGMAWALPTFVVSFLGSWLVWSIQVPRWRLWAYSRVRDIEQLKAAAVEKLYIWPDGSMFAKTEIMSKDVRQKLCELEARSRHAA